MNITAWALWDVATGEPADGARTLEAKAVLDAALARPGGMRHPGLLHLYVHLMEMSGHPETALDAADALRDLVPDAGHLQHMPTHIDVLCGDYQRVIGDNLTAIAADDRFAEYAGQLGFYSLYRAHDHHFRIYGAMFAGNPQVALEAADALAAAIPEELLRVEVPPMADWLEGFVPMKLHVLVRFGRWDELIALELPADPELYSVTTAMTHYAKAVALAARSRDGRCRARARAVRGRRRAGARDPLPVQQHLPRHPRHRGGDARRRDRLPQGRLRGGVRRSCGGPSSSTTACPTTSRGAGCSRRATPTARCCSSRARSSSPRRSTPPTSGSTARSAAPASTPTTCGACTATTSASTRLGQDGVGPDRQAAARPRAGARRRADHGVLLLPAARVAGSGVGGDPPLPSHEGEEALGDPPRRRGSRRDARACPGRGGRRGRGRARARRSGRAGRSTPRRSARDRRGPGAAPASRRRSLGVGSGHDASVSVCPSRPRAASAPRSLRRASWRVL